MPHRAGRQTTPRQRGVLAATLVVLIALLGQSMAAGAESFEDRALREANERIAAVEARLRSAQGDAAVAADRLMQLQADVDILEAAVSRAAEAVAQQQAEVARAADRLRQLESDAAAIEDALAVQVVALFKRGTAGQFEAVLAAGDLSAAIQRAEFVRVLGNSEKAMLEGLRNARVQVAAQQERFAAQQARLLAFEAEQASLLARAETARDEASAILSRARSNVASLARQQDDLTADAAALRDLIRQNSAAPTSGLAPSTAGYIWPICGVVTSEYGWRWGRMHEGVDIDGDTGDVIAAAKAGIVIHAGWQGGYGNLTLIDHGDGVVTAYGHQSAFYVDKGDSVVRGQKIGAVGNTGQSTGSHLHFETRVNGDATNPRRFLNTGC